MGTGQVDNSGEHPAGSEEQAQTLGRHGSPGLLKAVVEWRNPAFLKGLNLPDEVSAKFAKFGLFGEFWSVELEFDVEGRITGGRFVKPL